MKFGISTVYLQVCLILILIRIRIKFKVRKSRLVRVNALTKYQEITSTAFVGEKDECIYDTIGSYCHTLHEFINL